MDIDKANQLNEVAETQVTLCKEYKIFRIKAGKAKAELFILLVPRLKEFRLIKKNLGIDMSLMMLMEDNPLAVELYREWQESEAMYLGLDRLIEAHKEQIMVGLGVMKWQGQGEKFG